MKRQSKRQYIFDSGALQSGDSVLIRKVSEEYDKQYMAKYLRDYRKKTRRIELYFSMGDYKELESLGQDHELKPPAFIKAVLKDYQGQVKLVRYPSSIAKLITEIKRFSSLTNQLVRYAHSTKSMSEWNLLREQIQTLEGIVVQEMLYPRELTEYIRDAVMQSRLTAAQLHEILKESSNNI